MARSMYIGAIALVSLTLAGVRVQAQSEFKAEIGKTLTDSEECWPSVSSEHAQDSRGTQLAGNNPGERLVRRSADVRTTRAVDREDVAPR